MEAIMDTTVVAKITAHFQALSSVIPLDPINTEYNYGKAVAPLDQMLNAGSQMKNTRWPISPIPLAR